MVKRSRKDEEEVRNFMISAGCAHTLDGMPIPKFYYVLEKYTNVYGALLIGNELKANSRTVAYLTKHPFKVEYIHNVDKPAPTQKSLFDFASDAQEIST